MIKKSFPLRILMISFLVLALPLLVDSFIVFQSSYAEAIAKVKRNLQEIATFKGFQLAEAKPISQKILKAVDHIIAAERKANPEVSLDKVLENIAEAAPEFEFSILHNSKNNLYKAVASNKANLIGDIYESYHQFPSIFEDGSGAFLRYIYDPASGAYLPYIFVARVIEPVEKGEEQKVLLLATFAITSTLKEVLDFSKFSGGPYTISIVHRSGIVFASSNPEMIGQYFKPINKERYQELKDRNNLSTLHIADAPLTVIQRKNSDFFEYIFDGSVQLAYTKSIPNIWGAVVISSPKALLFGREVQKFFLLYLFYAIILLIGGGVTFWLTAWLSRPLRELSFVMGEVSLGNLDVRFEPRPLGYEINYLGTSFNATLKSILDNIQRLEDERVQKMTYQREIALGRSVQNTLISEISLPTSAVEMQGRYRFAQEVGGDFYDYGMLSSDSENNVFMVIADSVGKGISACLYSLAARSFIRTYATLLSEVGEILSHANNAFLKDTGETGTFIAVQMGVYSPKTGIFSYYSCGHTPGLVLREDGQIEELVQTGEAMGVAKSSAYRSHAIKLHAGDKVLFYTDGLLESTNSQGQLFSKERLYKLLQEKKGQSAKELVDALLYAFNEFMEGAIEEEEMTLLVMRVL